MKFLIFLIMTMSLAEEEMAITEEFIDNLKPAVDWEVNDYESNLFKGWTLDEVKAFLRRGKFEKIEGDIPTLPFAPPASVSWVNSECTHEVIDQRECRADYAIAVASMVSDRCCKQSKRYWQLSPQELISCVTEGAGCQGENSGSYFYYINQNGLVGLNCFSYKAKDTHCPLICENGDDWKASHHCHCSGSGVCPGVEVLKRCLYTGPVVARIKVYRDLLAYKGGNYCWNGKTSSLGDQYVKCLGYTSNPDVVTCANSWGTRWGEKGMFNIYMKDSCGFDTESGSQMDMCSY